MISLPHQSQKGKRAAGLLFHDVLHGSAVSGFQRRAAVPYKITTTAFEGILDAIAASPASPRRIFDCAFPPSSDCLFLTFDDGGSSACSVSQLLNDRGWSGHFLITTSRIGDPRFVSESDIRRLRDAGNIVGSHSHSHPDIFKALSPQEMRAEWQTSCGILSEILGEPCLSASVPGGDISRAVFDSARLEGIRYLFTSEPWLYPRRHGTCWVIGRTCIKAGTTAKHAGALASFEGWRRALIKRRIKGVGKTVLAPFYKYYVRAKTRELQHG